MEKVKKTDLGIIGKNCIQNISESLFTTVLELQAPDLVYLLSQLRETTCLLFAFRQVTSGRTW